MGVTCICRSYAIQTMEIFMLLVVAVCHHVMMPVMIHNLFIFPSIPPSLSDTRWMNCAEGLAVL